MRVLIGYDDSVPMEHFIQDLAEAGLPARTKVLILSVATAWGHNPFPQGKGRSGRAGSAPDLPYRGHLEEAFREMQALAERGKRLLRERFPDWDIKAEGAVDDAAEALLKKAEAWKADLIVVGPGRPAISRLFLGSVAQKVLHHAGTSVRIARPEGKGRRRPPRILVAMDGSDGSLGAVSAVCDRSWPEKTKVRLVSVVDARAYHPLLTSWAAPREGIRRSATRKQDWLEGRLEAAVERLAAEGLETKPVLLHGDPRRALLAHAKEWRAQVIFLGSRGLNTVERFVIGSVSSAVAMQAPCSVEVVKPKRRRNA